MLHFLYTLFIQIQNLIIQERLSDSLILFGQFENLFVSFLVIYLRTQKFIPKIITKFFYFALLLLLCFDQVYFKIFQQHFTFIELRNFSPSSLSFFWRSFFLEIDGWFITNLLLCFTVFLNVPHLRLNISKFRIPALLSIVAVIVASFFSQYKYFSDPITSHPLFTAFQSGSPQVSKRGELTGDVEGFLVTTKHTDLHEKLIFNNYYKEVSTSGKNVILVVLESVGSLQILKHKEIDKNVFPYLNSLQSKMIIFDRLYSMYPGTTRSHMAITTGGQTPTRSSLFDLSRFHYLGPSLPTEFKKRNYSTWLVSSMGLRFEELGKFYHDLNFDFVFDPDAINEKKRKNPWGVDEADALEVAFTQIKIQPKEKLFYLQFLTNSTHYPYLTGHNDAIKPEKARYQSAQKYTDDILRKLIRGLRENNLLENTIIFITGDHGEAFGEEHANNLTHRNYLYEENIRNFLLILDFGKIKQALVSSRAGGIADIMPTILSQEQSLLSPFYEEKIQFFHKNAPPFKWGLVDGNNKLISSYDEKDEEFYLLDSDPSEKVNLAPSHKETVKAYQQKLKIWFELKDLQFKENLRK